jgi:hypothetical protein
MGKWTPPRAEFNFSQSVFCLFTPDLHFFHSIDPSSIFRRFISY